MPWTPYPISLITGSKRFKVDDFPGAGGVHFQRAFNSRPAGGSTGTVYGIAKGFANWVPDFAFELHIGQNSAAGLLSPEGGYAQFRKNSSGVMEPDYTNYYEMPQTDYVLSYVGTMPSSWLSLELAKTYWTLKDAYRRTWNLETFADPVSGKYRIARPVTMKDEKGLQWTFAYDSSYQLQSITDAYGNQITFDWASGAITAAHLPGGSRINYTYDAISGAGYDRLVKVEYLNASSVEVDQVSYQYGDASYPLFVTAVLDKNNVTRWTVTYDGLGRALTSSGPSNVDKYSVAYSETSTTIVRTVTNALGKAAVYTFNRTHFAMRDPKLSTVVGQASANCPSSTGAFAYDSNRFLNQYTDEEGRITTYTRDATGRATQTVEAYGTSSARTTGVTWHSTLDLPSQIVEPGRTTDYTYDTAGRVLTRTETDTTSFTTPYATNGRTRTWTYTWSTNGQLLTADGPLAGAGDKVTYTYNGTNGYLATITNEVGKVTTISVWDPHGLPMTIVDPNSVTTTLTYDFFGRPLTTTVNPGGSQSVYTMAYDDVGNLSQLTLPGGGYLQYTYDTSSRLTQVLNDRGQKVIVTPNLMGDPTATDIKNASNTTVSSHAFAYDELGRMIQSIDAGPKTTTFGYDKVDNLKTVTDARSKLWQTAFDPLNRVITETNPDSQSVQRTYNGQDELTSQTDGRGKVTSRVVDGFGRTIREVSPERGTIDYWYDLNDNLTKLVDADGEETDFTYDNASRRLTAVFPAETSDNVTYTYDSTSGGNKGAGRLTLAQDASGTSAFTYDAQGRVTSDVKVIGARTYTVGYAYDVNGKVTQIDLPSGRQVLIARASDGLATGVTTKANSGATATTIASSIVYAPFGPLQSLTYGNGLALTRTLDLNFRISRIQVTASGANRLDLSFSRTNNGQLVDTTDNLSSGRTGNNGYTNSGRLAWSQGPWGEWDYAYDAAGNLTERSKLVGGVKTYAFMIPWGSRNRIDHVENGSGVATRNFSYRNGGDLAQDQRVGGDTYDYYYNARKRIVLVKKNTVNSGAYNYDAFGRRVSRTVYGGTTTTTHYIFDADGHLLAEHDNATGNVIKEYVWVDDTPMAVIDKSSGTAVTYFIHTGPIDEPLMMTDASKAKVWDAALEPYGTAQVFGTPTSSIDLRLPGQYLEAESGGLHQNWMRSYDPTLGRYVQTDPLGIDAGQNVYAYVDGRPLQWRDPSGLDVFVMTDTSAVQNQGHSGALVGNPIRGYDLMSKDGYDRHTNIHFNTLTDALNSTNATRYNEIVRITTTPIQDAVMITTGKRLVVEDYHFTTENCADFVQQLLRSVSIKYGDTRYFPGTPTVPNNLNNNLKGLGYPWYQR